MWHRLCVPAGKGHVLDIVKRTADNAPTTTAATLTEEDRLKRVRDTVLDAKKAAGVIKKLLVSYLLISSLACYVILNFLLVSIVCL